MVHSKICLAISFIYITEIIKLFFKPWSAAGAPTREFLTGLPVPLRANAFYEVKVCLKPSVMLYNYILSKIFDAK